GKTSGYRYSHISSTTPRPWYPHFIFSGKDGHLMTWTSASKSHLISILSVLCLPEFYSISIIKQPRKKTHDAMEKHWVKLFSTANPVQAEITKQMLEEHGVSAVMMNKQDSSYRFGQVELYVHESEEAFARGLIAEMEGEGSE